MLITGGSRQVLVISRNEPRADANSLATVCRGLGALIAERFAAEGCHLAINYVSNLERARETAAKVEDLESYEKKVVLVQGVCNFCSLSLSLSLCQFIPIQKGMMDLEYYYYRYCDYSPWFFTVRRPDCRICINVGLKLRMITEQTGRWCAGRL